MQLRLVRSDILNLFFIGWLLWSIFCAAQFKFHKSQFTIGIKLLVAVRSTKWLVEWKNFADCPKIFFYKFFVCFVSLKLYIWSLCSKTQCMLTEWKKYFWSMHKSHFGLTEKTAISGWPNGLLTKSSQHFSIQIYLPYKMYIFHCYKTYLSGTSSKKFPTI